GRFADKLEQAAADKESQLARVAVWNSAPRHGAGPWLLPEARRRALHEPSGWNVVRCELPLTGAASLRVVHRSAMDSMAWALFFCGTALGIWKCIGRTAALVVLTSLAAALALWLPATYAPLASAVFLSGTICLLVGMVDTVSAPVAPMLRAGP